MKIRRRRKRGGVLIELGPHEAQLPLETLFKLKRIFVPVDFTACSQKALTYALPFAKQFGAEIVLAHVVQPYIPVPDIPSANAAAILVRMRKSGWSELEKLRLSITDDVKIKTMLRVGNPADEIVKAAAEISADLILLSTHGRTGHGRVFFESVAEHVTGFASCPVLTVREREHEFVNVPETEAGARSTEAGAATSQPLGAS